MRTTGVSMNWRLPWIAVLVLLVLGPAPSATADDLVDEAIEPVVRHGSLVIPLFDPVRGRRLFVDQGCILCHSIGGIGGKVAPALDATSARPDLRPLDFVVRMWRGAKAMLALQEEELGYRVDLKPDELAAIIGFVHDRAEQARLTTDDLPEGMETLFIDEPFDGWTSLDRARQARTAAHERD